MSKNNNQPKLTAFMKKNSNESSSHSGKRQNHNISVNVFLNLELNSRIGKRNARTIYFVTAVPETETRSINREAHSTSSATVCTDENTNESTTVNVNVSLNIIARIRKCKVNNENKFPIENFSLCNSQYNLLFRLDINAGAAIVENGPTDICSYGTIRKMEPQKLKPGLTFPQTDKRKFNPKWLNDYIWMEYSVSKNAVFCYACRQLSPVHDRDNVFKYTGFAHWKTALESNKGFKRHQSCVMHSNSMAKWSEAIEREKNNTSVIQMASGNVLEYRRNYMKKIIEVLYYHR